MIRRFCVPAAFTALLLAGCSNEASAPQAGLVSPEAAAQQEADPAPEPAEPHFDIRAVPVSDAPLGEFPYFALPDGYETTEQLSSTIEAGRFPFWVGDHYVAVEGRIYQANIRAKDGKTYSTLEVQKNTDHLVRSAGGVMVAEGVIPRAESAEVLTRGFTREFANGLCWPSEPVRTYVVRRTDKDIWVHACTYGGIGAAWVIAETSAVEPTAKLLPSSELRKSFDALSKATIQINFASDSARILAASEPQLDAIAELLRDDEELSVLVVGHTDDTGTESRNQTLSEQRASSVVAALVERGTAPTRLGAEGRGRSEPVAGNETAEGRSVNRRVELLRRPSADAGV